jgi:hypothetical protein
LPISIAPNSRQSAPASPRGWPQPIFIVARLRMSIAFCRREAGGATRSISDKIWDVPEPQERQGARPYCSRKAVSHRRCGDRVTNGQIGFFREPLVSKGCGLCPRERTFRPCCNAHLISGPTSVCRFMTKAISVRLRKGVPSGAMRPSPRRKSYSYHHAASPRMTQAREQATLACRSSVELSDLSHHGQPLGGRCVEPSKRRAGSNRPASRRA